MSDFGFYFSLGLQHIFSIEALDHILFVTALSAVYALREWKKVLVLVTAFTIGHCITLLLSARNIVTISEYWIELSIAGTIVVTALVSMIVQKISARRWQYLLALAFGLVHGLGFANAIKFMLAEDQNILKPLFAFNVGLEIAQIVVVLVVLIIHYFWKNTVNKERAWLYIVEGACFAGGMVMIWQRM